jgi:hypothetical protein
MKYLFVLVILSILMFNLSNQNTTSNEKKNESKEAKIKNKLNSKGMKQTNDKAKIDKNKFLKSSVSMSKNGRRETYILKKVKLGKYTVIILNNSDLSTNVKKLKNYMTYSKCNKKTGFLNYIQKRPSEENKEITVYPIYVTLNKYTLSLFYSFDSLKLFKIIKLDSILRVALQYDKTYCFDIIINEIEDKRLKTGILSLCAKNINEMKNWIRAILEFKECKIMKSKRKSSIPHQGRTLIDFNKINTLIKKSKRTTSVSQISYNGNDKVSIRNPMKEEEKRIISKEINKIIHTIHMTKIYKNQLRRKMVSQLRRTRGKTKGAYRTQKLLHSILLKKNYSEKKQYANMIKKLNTKRTTTLLRSISRRITEISVMYGFNIDERIEGL